MKPFAAILLSILLGVSSATSGIAKEHRSSSVKHEFQREQPCPSTGKPVGACSGYVKDHVVPLCKGGPDTTANLQWQTTAEGKAKDRVECR
jgi:hypothetical protein